MGDFDGADFDSGDFDDGATQGFDFTRFFQDRKDLALTMHARAVGFKSHPLQVQGKAISSHSIGAGIAQRAIKPANSITSLQGTAVRSQRLRKRLKKQAARRHDYG